MRTTADRGYGTDHEQARAKYQRDMRAGYTYQCACDRPDCPKHTGRCPTIITGQTPTRDWNLGHNDTRTGYIGPECEYCNKADGARRGNALRQPPAIIREW